MSNNNPSEANPSGVESLNGQEENRTVGKHMSSTGTGGDGGFDTADEVKDWNFNALISGDELITGDEQEGMAARSGDGGLGMESQERSSIPDETGEVPLTALSVLSSLPAANLREKAEQPQFQTTQSNDLDILIEEVEIEQHLNENRRKRKKKTSIAKDESILRNERAKKLLSEQKKIADGSGYMAEKAQTWLAEHRRKGRERALRSRKKQKAKAAARGLLQLHGSDDEEEDAGVKKDQVAKDGEKTEVNGTKASEGGKTAVDGGVDEKFPLSNDSGPPLVWDKSSGNDTREL